MREPRAQAAFAALILLALMVGLYREVVFNGRSLIHTNYSNPIDWRPLPDNYGPDMVPHDEWTRRGQWPFPNIRDPAATWWQWDPGTEYFKRAIAAREWPFWDPYVAAGTPAMANLVQAFFFPPYLLLVLLGATVALKNVYFLGLLWAAAFATYLFLRRHDLGFVASLGGALVVLMSGAFNQNLGAFAGQTIACLPFTLYVTRLLLDRPDARRAALVALVYGASALASFPPILIGVFGVTALYAACGIVLGDGTNSSTLQRRAGWWSAATVLSLGLVAAYYLPAVALHRAMPHVAAIYAGSGLETIPFFKALQLWSPTVAGGVQLYWNDPFFVNGAAHIPYVGVIALLAAAMARPGAGRQRALFWSSLGATAAILLKVFGVPPVQWIGAAPLLNGIHFSHYLGVALAVPIAALAALGLDRIARAPSSVLAVAVPGALGATALAVAWRVADAAGVHRGPTAAFWRADWNVLAALTAAVIIALAITLLAPVRARVAAVTALLVLVSLEGFYNNSYLRPKRWDMFAHPAPYVRVLKREARMTRVFPFGVPEANVNEGYGIYSVGSLMALNPPRIHEVYREYSGAPAQVFLREASRLPPEGVLDRASVSFVGAYLAQTQVVEDAARRGYEPRFNDGFFTLLRRNTAPRFFFSSEYRVLPRAEALEAIATAPAREVVIEEAPSFASTANHPDDPAVALLSYRLNGFTLAVNAPRPGLVYASESVFDGWSATVNGSPAPILPANYAFRAVAVPAGQVRVEFRYWPPGLTLGLVVTSISGLAVGALFFSPRGQREH